MEEHYNPALASSVIGHENILSCLQKTYKSPKPAHGWLFLGNAGIGKATTAYHWAAELLSGESFHTTAFLSTKRSISQGTHPDIKIVKEEKEGKLISIEAVRDLIDFMRKTAVGELGRVAIIDGAHLLTRQAANSLLKILEEPPTKTVLILIAQGTVLPTLRSRCRVQYFSSLTDKDIEKILNQSLDKRLLTLAGGSVGRALSFQKEEMQTFLKFLDLFFLEQKKGDLSQLIEFCRDFKGPMGSLRDLILSWIADQAKKEGGEKKLKLARAWSEIHEVFMKALDFSLEKNQTLLQIFGTMAKALREN